MIVSDSGQEERRADKLVREGLFEKVTELESKLKGNSHIKNIPG